MVQEEHNGADETLREARKELAVAKNERSDITVLVKRLRRHFERNDFADRLIREIQSSRRES